MSKDNRTRITQIQNDLAGIEEKLKEFQTLKEAVDNSFNVIEEKATEATNIKNEITTIKSDIDTILDTIQEKQTQASEFETSIEELVEEAQSSKDTFEEHSKNLSEIEDKIHKFEKAINEQLGRAGAGALALAFNIRQTEIEDELKRWREILYYATGGLLILAVVFFVYSFFISELTLGFFLKISISLPFIYVVWFASKQYSKERFILERYAFKTAQAKSLDAFSKTVKEMDSSEEGSSRAQEFVINSVAKIYVAPKLQGEDPEFPLTKVISATKDIVKSS